MVNWLATNSTDLTCGVPFYGSHAETADVPNISIPLMIQSAEEDPRINAGWDEFEKALQEARVDYQRHLYPGTQHGFHNDTNAALRREGRQAGLGANAGVLQPAPERLTAANRSALLCLFVRRLPMVEGSPSSRPETLRQAPAIFSPETVSGPAPISSARALASSSSGSAERPEARAR